MSEREAAAMAPAGGGTALLQAEGLHKQYRLGRKDVPVLRGAGLTARAGESVAVVGASGSGKSTLLHVLGGLDHPDAGRVRVDGADLYAMRPVARSRVRATRIGFVFQSYHLLPEMDVLENVVLPTMARGGLRAGARERARVLLAAVGLADRLNHTPLELSGGEQQRVALARALINRPSLILADEPTGNLDARTGAVVLDQLMGLVRDAGATLIMVTHNDAVASICDRTLRLLDGSLHDA